MNETTDKLAAEGAGWSKFQVLSAPDVTLILIHELAARITELEAERDGYAALIATARDLLDALRARVELLPAEAIRAQNALATVDTSAVVQAIRDKAFEEAAQIADKIKGSHYPQTMGWASADRVAAAIRSQQGK